MIPAGTRVYSYVTAGSSVLLEKDQEQVEALCFVCKVWQWKIYYGTASGLFETGPNAAR